MTRSIIAASAAAVAMLAASAAHAADVNLTLTGLKEGGDLYVSLQTEDQFMQNDGVSSQAVRGITGGDVTLTLEAPAGTYALSIWHDIDGDGEFDMSEQGWPEDGWAAYKGTQLRGEPTFDTVSFEVPESGFTLSEPMIYPEFYMGQ